MKINMAAGLLTAQVGAQEGESPSVDKELTERVNRINSRVSGWAYQIPQHKYQAMSKRLEDLLAPTETP
jgi:hypothetical protein